MSIKQHIAISIKFSYICGIKLSVKIFFYSAAKALSKWPKIHPSGEKRFAARSQITRKCSPFLNYTKKPFHNNSRPAFWRVQGYQINSSNFSCSALNCLSVRPVNALIQCKWKRGCFGCCHSVLDMGAKERTLQHSTTFCCLLW